MIGRGLLVLEDSLAATALVHEPPRARVEALPCEPLLLAIIALVSIARLHHLMMRVFWGILGGGGGGGGGGLIMGVLAEAIAQLITPVLTRAMKGAHSGRSSRAFILGAHQNLKLLVRVVELHTPRMEPSIAPPALHRDASPIADVPVAMAPPDHPLGRMHLVARLRRISVMHQE